jgi:hypothetical protein
LITSSTAGEEQWQQTGRWVIYEETLEWGAQRFGKPHLATLSLHSMLELRHCIEMGAW